MTDLDRSAMAAIVIGASRPNDDPDVATRLAATADEMRAYLEADSGFGLAKDRVLWLFNSSDAPHEQEATVASAVDKWAKVAGLVEGAPLNMVLVIIGHGEKDGSIRLAEARYNEQKPMLDVDRLSARIVSNAPLGSRYFVYLDCCYAGAVFNRMEFKPKGGFALGTEADTVPVTRGVLGLLAASKELKALAPPGATYTRMGTLFFDALQASQQDRLSLDDLEASMIACLKQREATLENWQRLRTPQPFVQLKYEEARELLRRVSLFPTGWRSDKPTFQFPEGDTRSSVTVIVVQRETGNEKLVDSVKAALYKWGDDLATLVGRPISKPLSLVILDVGHAFDDEAELSKRLRALAKADLVVFDVTSDDQGHFEPGVMLLLGARAVVRRGVTICSVDAELVFDYPLPYNLMYVNLSSHADPDSAAPKILRNKMAAGFTELREHPTYLDLPAYDAVRNLGGTLDAFEPKPDYVGALYLGPFDRSFQKNCFEPLEQRLKDDLEALAKVRLGRNYTTEQKPHVRRLLDENASKLVALSLYEAIRRYDLCLVDWSDWRPNVFFELGVRIAANDSGAVHIIAQGRRPKSGLRQMTRMEALFNPIEYRLANFDAKQEAVERIIARFNDGAAKRRDKQLFRDIAAGCETAASDEIAGLAVELHRRADLTFADDKDNRSPSAAIYSNNSLMIRNAAFSKSIGLRLAALFVNLGARTPPQHVRNRLARVMQQVDRLDRSGGDATDVQALRGCATLLAGMLSTLRTPDEGKSDK
jgi:hypothetical protein